MVVAWSQEPPVPGSPDDPVALVVAWPLGKVRGMIEVLGRLRGKFVRVPGMFCMVKLKRRVQSTKNSAGLQLLRSTALLSDISAYHILWCVLTSPVKK